MDELIDKILSEMPDPIPEGQQFIDLDDQVSPPVRLPAAETAEWVDILNDAKEEFEVDGATAVFSTWTRLTLATLKSLMVCTPEPDD